ncbi:MAG: stage II sporulation protein M [Bacillota bacterium]|nr:stage II sporulation protein M [Bacillota bacterium]
MFTLFFPVRQVIRENRSWFVMAASIFIACFIILYYTAGKAQPLTEQAIESQFEQMVALFSIILGASPLISTLLIFMNNFISMVQMLMLGVAAGISPLITLGVNGALVGAMIAFSVQEGIPFLTILGFGILPHGIFELFAFFISAGIGLKFGYHCIASPLPGKTRMQSYRYIWKEAISILPLIVLLLILAAFIEVFITAKLLGLVL